MVSESDGEDLTMKDIDFVKSEVPTVRSVRN